MDGLILLPLAIPLAVELVPAEVMAEHRATALAAKGQPASRAGAVLVVAPWVATAALLTWWLWPRAAR